MPANPWNAYKNWNAPSWNWNAGFPDVSVSWPATEVRVDKGGEGSFWTPGDNVSGDVLIDKHGVTIARGRDSGRILAPASAGRMGTVLENSSGDYSPGSTTSQGKPIQVRTYWDGVSYNTWTGLLDIPRQRPGEYPAETELVARGNFTRLAGRKVSTALYSSITIDVAIGHLLDAAGWPTADRSLEVGLMTLDWWWLDDDDAMVELQKLINTEGPGAAAFEAGDGVFTFHNRHHILTDTSSTAIQKTFNDFGTSPLYVKPWGYDDGERDKINFAEMVQKIRTAKSLAAFWDLGAALVLGNDEVRTFVVRDSASNPITAAVAPVITTDYTVSAGSITSMTLDRTSGGRITLTITAGSGGATLATPGVQVRGQLVTVDNETGIKNTLDPPGSTDRIFSDRRAYLSEIDVDEAQGLVNSVIAFYSEGRPTFHFTVRNMDTATTTAALDAEINDRVRLIESRQPFDKQGYIQHIQTTIGQGKLTTVYTAEEALAASEFATWDAAKWDISRWAF